MQLQSDQWIDPDVQGKLTVVLDLDGTLISSFTPRRAPRQPPGTTSYVVGRGGRLNPQGVFVVERPGLQEFFSRLSSFAGIQAHPNGSVQPHPAFVACMLLLCLFYPFASSRTRF